MSRRWFRAAIESYCGNCDATIAVGSPVCELGTPAWKKQRCTACAGEPVPADLSPLPPRQTVVPRLLAPAGSTLPLDWKQKQAGDEA